MEWIRENRPCPICASESFKPLGTRGGASHRDGLGEETTVVKCLDCTANYARPTMIPHGNPYDEEQDYFAIHDVEKVKENSKRLVNEAESLLGRKGRMLELGCGRGILLQVAQEAGWKVKGVEMTEQFAREAVGVDVEVSTIEDCESLKEKYDVIMLAAILEHLYHPVEILKKIGAALNPGGLLFIDVPNEDSLSQYVGSLYVRPWCIYLSPTFSPYHVIGFTPKSMEKALSLAGMGIAKLEVVKYSVTLPGGGLKRNVERLGIGMLHKLGHLVGKGDGLVVWARKQ